MTRICMECSRVITGGTIDKRVTLPGGGNAMAYFHPTCYRGAPDLIRAQMVSL